MNRRDEQERRGTSAPARAVAGSAFALGLAACCAALLAPAAARAIPPEPPFYENFYAGGGLGAAQGADVDEATLRRPFDAQEIAIEVVDKDDGWDLAWHAFLGYQVCRFFALEGAYTSLGAYSFDAQIVEDPGRFVAELRPRIWSISGLFTTPPWKGLSAFGKVGAAFWNTDLDVDQRLGAGLLATSDDAKGTSVVWGFGGRFDFSKHVGLRVEWERFEDIGRRKRTGQSDFDAVLGSLVFSF